MCGKWVINCKKLMIYDKHSHVRPIYLKLSAFLASEGGL